MTDTSENALRVPERMVRLPAHASEEARAVLSQPFPPKAEYPALDDKEGWRANIAQRELFLAQMLAGRANGFAHTLTELREQGALAYDIRPQGWTEADRRVYLYIHGGALIMGGDENCKTMSLIAAKNHGVRVVTVDYQDAARPSLSGEPRRLHGILPGAAA